MIKNSLRNFPRCPSSRRALSNYNNNNTGCNATTVSPTATHRISFYSSKFCHGSNRRMFSSGAQSNSRPTSPNLAEIPLVQQQQQHKAMELHMEIRLSLLELINEFASHDIPQVSLNDMLKFKDFTVENELENTKSLIENANFTMYTLLVLNCKRLKEFNKLPYLCVINPNIANIFNTYVTSLEKLMKFIGDHSDKKQFDNNDNISNYYQNFQITDLQTNEEFLSVLNEILLIHTDNLPILSDGFKEISQYLLIDDDQLFLNNHLEERILLRLSIKHHVLLSEHFAKYSQEHTTLANINNIGMIDKDLDVIQLIKEVCEFVNDMSSLKYDERISIAFETVIMDATDTKVKHFPLSDTYKLQKHQQIIFPYIASHLKYVLQEILKNSSRAQIENNIIKPIQITIVINKRSPQSYLELRIRDQGKGISRGSLANLFEYSFTTVLKNNNDNDNYEVFNNGTGTDGNIIAGMGYGLPLSKLYVEMFGGSLELQSYEGWGTDVYIKLQGPESRLLE